MLQLPNNCYCGKISVHPLNWDQAGASTKEKWYIQYRFYDPVLRPAGKLCVVKSGINPGTTLAERQASVRVSLKFLINKLEEGYNPVTGESTPPQLPPEPEPIETQETDAEADYDISPDLPFILALNRSLDKIEVDPCTKANIKSTLLYFSKAAKTLKFDSIPIGEVKRKHVRFSLEHCEKVKDYWSNSLFNNYRRDLSMLFKELIKLEAVEHNVVKEIERKIVIKGKKAVLSPEKRSLVNKGISSSGPGIGRFLRFIHIFHHSGSRITELVNVKGDDVDISNRKFRVLIKKGKQYTYKWKPIKDVALLFWIYAIMDCGQDDYVFHKGLKPASAAKPIRPEQITRRWKRHVKNKLQITEDFNSIRHLNLTQITAYFSQFIPISQAERISAGAASHTTTKMIQQVYDVENKERKDEAIRSVPYLF